MKRKNWMAWLLVLSLLAALTGCAGRNEDPPAEAPVDTDLQDETPDNETPEEPDAGAADDPAQPQDTDAGEAMPAAEAVLTGTLADVSDTTLLLAGAGANDLYTLGTGLPVYDADGNPTEEAPAAGQQVAVGYSGAVMETYPAQLGGAVYLQLLSEPDDRIGLYLTALDDLWNTDTALNDDTTYLAFDLSGAANLTEGEKSALVWQAAGTYGKEPLTGSFDELCEQGYIDREALYFDNGLLIELTVTEEGEDTFTFDLTKWRSGLGAYFFSGCTAQRTGDGWTYEVGAEMIS